MRQLPRYHKAEGRMVLRLSSHLSAARRIIVVGVMWGYKRHPAYSSSLGYHRSGFIPEYERFK